MLLVGISGLGLIAVGLIAIAAPDLVWSFTQRRNEALGQASERTERWDRSNRIGAVIGIAAGLVVLVVAIAD